MTIAQGGSVPPWQARHMLSAGGGGQCQGQGEGAVEEHESAVLELVESVFDGIDGPVQLQFGVDRRGGGWSLAAGAVDVGQGVLEGVYSGAAFVSPVVYLEEAGGRPVYQDRRVGGAPCLGPFGDGFGQRGVGRRRQGVLGLVLEEVGDPVDVDGVRVDVPVAGLGSAVPELEPLRLGVERAE